MPIEMTYMLRSYGGLGLIIMAPETIQKIRNNMERDYRRKYTEPILNHVTKRDDNEPTLLSQEKYFKILL